MYIHISLHIEISIHLETVALVDSGANQNCIREGIIPTQFYEKTSEQLHGANGSNLNVRYKLSNAKIYNDNYCLEIVLL